MFDAERPDVGRNVGRVGDEAQLLSHEQSDNRPGKSAWRIGIQHEGEPDSSAAEPLWVAGDGGKNVGAAGSARGEADDVVLGQPWVLEEPHNNVRMRIVEELLEDTAVWTTGERFPLSERERPPCAARRRRVGFALLSGQFVVYGKVRGEGLTDEAL